MGGAYAARPDRIAAIDPRIAHPPAKLSHIVACADGADEAKGHRHCGKGTEPRSHNRLWSAPDITVRQP